MIFRRKHPVFEQLIAVRESVQLSNLSTGHALGIDLSRLEELEIYL